MFPVHYEELRINHHLILLLVVTMTYARWFLWWADCIEDFQVTSSFSNSGLHFEELFWERYSLKSQIRFEGHWSLQSQTHDRWCMCRLRRVPTICFKTLHQDCISSSLSSYKTSNSISCYTWTTCTCLDLIDPVLRNSEVFGGRTLWHHLSETCITTHKDSWTESKKTYFC